MATAPAANRVLVVEDDAAIRRMMTTHLRKQGYAVDYAMSAEEVSADEPYDLVVTDVHLPGESGVELAKRIRRTQPEQRVVFMTGDNDATIAREAMDTGAAGYLLKPFEFFELDAVVNYVMPTKNAKVQPLTGRAHVTKPAQVVLSGTRARGRSFAALRNAAVVTAMLGVSAAVGMALSPEGTPEAPVSYDTASSAPIVVPVVLDKTVYISQQQAATVEP